LFDKIMSSIAFNPWLSGSLAVMAFVLFIIHPVLGLVGLGGAAIILWALSAEIPDEIDYKVDDSEGMKLPPSDDK
jgi:hypothetical protein